MIHRVPRLGLFWLLLVWFVSFPWIGFTPEPQWHRVHVVPFADPADRIRDMVANVFLFLPFGFIVTRKRPHVRGLLRAVLLALAVSVSAEATQLFSTRRHPSATDVTAAVLGTLAGGLTTLSLRSSSKPRTWTD